MTDTTTRIAIYAANENIATQINALGFGLVARTMADGSILAEDASRECGGGISTLLFGCACGPGLVTIPEVAGWYLETMNAHRVEWFEADTEGAGFTEDFNMEIAKAETIAADLNAARAALWAGRRAPRWRHPKR